MMLCTCGKTVEHESFGQCDDCVVMWAYDKAIRDFDAAITRNAVQTEQAYLADNVSAWRKTAEDRGLIARRQ